MHVMHVPFAQLASITATLSATAYTAANNLALVQHMQVEEVHVCMRICDAYAVSQCICCQSMHVLAACLGRCSTCRLQKCQQTCDALVPSCEHFAMYSWVAHGT